jgi:hypothetical protein
MGAKFSSKTHLLNMFLIFEPFRLCLTSKFAKSGNMFKNKCLQKSNMGIKNAEFCVDFIKLKKFTYEKSF